MHQLKLLNKGYKYNKEDNVWEREIIKGKIILALYTCEVVYSLKMESQEIDDSFEYEDFDEAIGLIENILG